MSKSWCERSTDPDAYVEDYFLTECDGYELYLDEENVQLPPRLRTVWSYLDVHDGMRVLDVGCGRGEIPIYCGMEGVTAVGVDYSEAALRLAQRFIARTEKMLDDGDVWVRPGIISGNAKFIPLPDLSVDRVVMSDIVEHLYPSELDVALREVYRVLARGGELLIHTMPNLWYYRYGYPFFRFVQRLRGIQVPSDPRERFDYSHVHVNEQNPWSLYKSLSNSRFTSWRVWLYDYRDYEGYPPLLRISMRLLTALPLLRSIFCDDIFARATK